MQFTNFDARRFLRDHWQKQPVVIRNPWGEWRNPLDPDELAGLACEEGVESRLVAHAADHPLVEHGPLPETRFTALGDAGWTFLVQAADQHAPDVAALIEPFRFVPDWRIDDVMVSYATDGGGVGPHYDQYDVFLIQGLGRRRWRVGPQASSDTPLHPHDDLRLIADFEASDEWILEPGDILYIPPRFAHDGIAIGGDCMTYSIGFRAPSRGELIEGWCVDRVDATVDDDRYADPDLTIQSNAGEITPAAIDRLHAMVIEALSDRDAFARWFGTFNSQPRYPEVDWSPPSPVGSADVQAMLTRGAVLGRNPACRFSFIREDQAVLLFVDGQCHDCTGESAMLAERICAQPALTGDAAMAASGAAVSLVALLINAGSLAFLDED